METRAEPGPISLSFDIRSLSLSAISSWDHVIATSTKLLKAAAILGLPAYATEQAPKSLGNTVDPLLSLLKELPAPTTTIPKTRFSMLLPEPSTEEWLKSAKINSVILFGIESHVCVLQSTLDLLEKGYSVHVVADGVSSCNDAERGIALEVSDVHDE